MHSFLLLIALVIIPAAFFLLLFLIISLKSKKEYLLKSDLEDLQGRINISYQQLELEEARNGALRFKLKRYDTLAVVTEKLNQTLSLDDTVTMLLEETHLLIGQPESLCLAYLIDEGSGEISLFSVKAEQTKKLIIKEKQGDIYDQWALKHIQPLLVEDTANDFRFDFEKAKKNEARKIGSLVCCCLVSQYKPIGLLRLDSPSSHAFTLEDLRLLSTISDVATVAIDNSQYYQHLKELAIGDSLTGVYTRTFILERLDEEIQRALLSSGSVSVMMIDIDFFKQYNDHYGHLAGDVVLKSLCLWCKSLLEEKNAVMGRYGGEEFLIIAPLISKEEAFILAENIRSVIQEKKITLRRKSTGITLSIGVANFPQDAHSAAELLTQADSALYEAKKTGRNRVCLF